MKITLIATAKNDVKGAQFVERCKNFIRKNGDLLVDCRILTESKEKVRFFRKQFRAYTMLYRLDSDGLSFWAFQRWLHSNRCWTELVEDGYAELSESEVDQYLK